MDYLGQLIARERERDFIREADDARLRSLVGAKRPASKPAPRNPLRRLSER